MCKRLQSTEQLDVYVCIDGCHSVVKCGHICTEMTHIPARWYTKKVVGPTVEGLLTGKCVLYFISIP